MNFTVRLPAPGASVTIDPIGDGDIVHTLGGPGLFASFTTVYAAGVYRPIVVIGSNRTRLKLMVGEFAQPQLLVGISEIIKAVMWPLVAFVAFLFLWPTLRKLLPHATTVELFGATIQIGELENSLRDAVDTASRALERVFPRGKADKFLPSSEPDLDYWVHVALFLNSINVPIKGAAVWNAIGAYFFTRDQTKSREAFERSIAVDPEDHAPFTTLGMWYLRIANDLNRARELFLKSIGLASSKGADCPWAHIGLAAVARNLNDAKVHEQERSLAEQQLRQAVSANPADFWALHGFGWCKFHEGRFDEARFFMEKAVQLKPDFDAARYNLACLHGRQQRVRESVEQLRRIVANEAGNKLTLLGVSAEADFRSIQNEVEFATFFEAVGIIYRP